MGSVSAVNPGLADLLQALTNLNSPVMSKPTAVSALKSAPTADIVQLSAAATQLEGIDAMFGISTSATDEMGSSLMAELQNPAPGTPTWFSTASSADQATNVEAQIQSELTQGLFGTPTSSPGSLFSAIG